MQVLAQVHVSVLQSKVDFAMPFGYTHIYVWVWVPLAPLLSVRFCSYWAFQILQIIYRSSEYLHVPDRKTGALQIGPKPQNYDILRNGSHYFYQYRTHGLYVPL
jgi:hypothetical protein